MIKTLFKKISKISIILSLLLFSQNIYAIGNKIVTFKPVGVLITNQLFVFKETYGSLEDDFDDVFKEVSSFLIQNGATSHRKALLYLDYGVTKTNPDIMKSNINVNDSILKYITDTYGESTLKSYRRVLVGYLVPPQLFVATREPFKEYGFKNIRVQATQSMDKDVKTPLSVLYENGETIQDDAIDANNIDSYTKPHRLYDKIAMLNFISLNEKSTDYVGMMEMYDNKLKVYTFMAIPGNQEKFMEASKIPLTIKEGDFAKRPDVEIDETNKKPSNDQATPNNTNAPEQESSNSPAPSENQ